jgi:hypothetical protein
MTRQFAGAVDDLTNRHELSADIYPGRPACIIRNNGSGCEIALVRRNLPRSSKVISRAATKRVGKLRAKVEDVDFPELLKVKTDPANKPGDELTPNARFAIDKSEPLAFFASIWPPHRESVREVTEGNITNSLFGVVTCEPNRVVAWIQPKAMPTILSTKEEVEAWLSAPYEEAKE